MKKLTYFCSAVLVFALLGMPAAAQKDNSNKGGAKRGDARVELVKAKKKDKKGKKSKKDKDHDPDNDTNNGRHMGDVNGRAKGHRH